MDGRLVSVVVVVVNGIVVVVVEDVERQRDRGEYQGLWRLEANGWAGAEEPKPMNVSRSTRRVGRAPRYPQSIH